MIAEVIIINDEPIRPKPRKNKGLFLSSGNLATLNCLFLASAAQMPNVG